MVKQVESTLGERMQGTRHEGDIMIAASVLNGWSTLHDVMARKQKAGIHVDWDFVKQYIAAHRHEYPDYKD